MLEPAPSSSSVPFFSVVIPVFNDWSPLDRCLRSLAEETHAPSFEVLVVDDGSREPAPEFIRRWADSFPLEILRQPHAGIASARNRGIQNSRGSILVFVDADSKLEPHCLSALASAIEQAPEHGCFQLHLTGDCSRLVGRAEELRLMTLQSHMLQPDGCIRYLNTAGFAIRRKRVNVGEGVFEPSALRSEDTLFLANLMQVGELPLFVPEAVVQHAIPLSLLGCFLKDVRSAFPESRTDALIAQKGVRIRVGHRERLSMASSMWKSSKRQSIGRLAWFVVLARQGLLRIVSGAYAFFRARRGSHLPESSS